ncbi:unnamed protein product [Candida verbasci]|uniref:Uncharacterized protein n=1 Tax=Candida verbasci TaxID=1227364 RepID=A0A9W4TSA2_9ASCO|nr:unnamed protein product [Candida verbasci]
MSIDSHSLINKYQHDSTSKQSDVELYRSQVDNIFKLTSYDSFNSIQSHYYELMNFEIETPSIINIISLTIQLNKLKLIDLKYKLESIKHIIAKYNEKINKLREEIKSKSNKISILSKDLEDKKFNLITSNEIESSIVNKQVQDIKEGKMKLFSFQFNKIQFEKFEILNEYNFQNYNKEGKKFLFNNQPILKLTEFLNYNLIIINQFLERLIILQIQLYKIFDKFELPYLTELQNYLPDQDFYNLIQKKEMMIIGKTKESEEGLEKQSIKEYDIKDIGNTDEKILKLGNNYKLPLSSKTLNYQRRNQNFNNITPEDLNNIPIIKNTNTNNLSSSISKSNSTSKKIIIPHKIINKPFNKLSIKDFLKFLIIIVKIIINFQVFLQHHPNKRTSNFELSDWCDFEKVLTEIVQFKSLFDNKEGEITNDKRAALPSRNITQSKHEIFQNLIDNVYIQIIKSEKNNKPPIQLQDLHLKNLLSNFQNKNNQNDDINKVNSDSWNLVSDILLL